MEDIKKRIEAVLFVLNRPIEVNNLAMIVGIGSGGIVKDCLEELRQDYNNKDSALEIIEEDGKYRMNIKKEYVGLVKSLMSTTELEKPVLETLSVIAWKQPILQSEVVRIRGTTTYEHMKILTELGFVVTERYGNSKLVKLTPKFYEYFDTNKDAIRAEFNKYKSKVENSEKAEQEYKQRLEEINHIAEHNKRAENKEAEKEQAEINIQQDETDSNIQQDRDEDNIQQNKTKKTRQERENPAQKSEEQEDKEQESKEQEDKEQESKEQENNKQENQEEENKEE